MALEYLTAKMTFSKLVKKYRMALNDIAFRNHFDFAKFLDLDTYFEGSERHTGISKIDIGEAKNGTNGMDFQLASNRDAVS